MAKIKLLIDTDIFIDVLKGIKPAKELFRIKGPKVGRSPQLKNFNRL